MQRDNEGAAAIDLGSVPTEGVIEHSSDGRTVQLARVQLHDAANRRTLVAWRRSPGRPELEFGWLPSATSVSWVGFSVNRQD